MKEYLSIAGKEISQINFKDTINYLGIYYKNIYGWFLRINLSSSIKYIASRLPVNIANELAKGFTVEPASKGLGESRVIINSAEDIKQLKDFVIKSFEVLLDE